MKRGEQIALAVIVVLIIVYGYFSSQYNQNAKERDAQIEAAVLSGLDGESRRPLTQAEKEYKAANIIATGINEDNCEIAVYRVDEDGWSGFHFDVYPLPGFDEGDFENLGDRFKREAREGSLSGELPTGPWRLPVKLRLVIDGAVEQEKLIEM